MKSWIIAIAALVFLVCVAYVIKVNQDSNALIRDGADKWKEMVKKGPPPFVVK